MSTSALSSRRQGIFWICTLSCREVPHLPALRSGELPAGVVWIRGQQELGASGYLHWQFVCAFAKKASLAAVKTLFGRSVHAELSRSELASDYCCKEDTRQDGPWEWGAKPIRRNVKTDWDSVWAAAITGNVECIPTQIRVCHYGNLQRIRSDYVAPLPIVRTVWVFWGRTGTGKSRRAWDEGGLDSYSKCPRSKFWDGYQGQKVAILDEFRGGIDISHILRWTDRYPVRVEVKGSSRPLQAEVLYFTSNVDPRLWYPELDEETKQALLRRLNIIHFI